MKNKIGIGKVNSWGKVSKKGGKSNKILKYEQAFENESKVIVYPAKSEEKLLDRKLRVAAYCRVSTDEENQLTSFTLQVNHYTTFIKENESWEFVGVYADEGISGTALNNRADLLRMLEDCKQGKIDHILTKNIARFSRNSREFMNTLHDLSSLKPKVTVFFSDENINSTDQRFENDLHFYSMVAQGESVRKSGAIKWSNNVRFRRGMAIVPTHCMLGYAKDKDNNIIIVPKEAKVIKFIYKSFLDGLTVSQIALDLTTANIPTVKGNNVWSSAAIRNILKNEKYAGDALMQKTFTPNCLDHKSVINRGEMTQYFKKNHHIAIIARNDWNETQKQLERRKFERIKKPKPKQILVVKSVKKGIFSGFEILNPKWTKKESEMFLQKFREEE